MNYITNAAQCVKLHAEMTIIAAGARKVAFAIKIKYVLLSTGHVLMYQIAIVVSIHPQTVTCDTNILSLFFNKTPHILSIARNEILIYDILEYSRFNSQGLHNLNL